MGLKYKNGDEVSDSIGLLISILVRYPEVATINYEPQSHVLRFAFMSSRVLSDVEGKILGDNIISCLETFNFLEARQAQVIRLEHSRCDNVTVLEVQRDVETLTGEEIALIIALMHQEFPGELVADENDSLMEEDLLMQEELIGHMLENMKGAIPEKKLIAFREEGRVLVFNK
ncbi:hypothetical protein SY88_00665 [Clostridiales bacterium PH28_bin88]|nr:hypothetical protein SY88_00665 [Clostridiales bacterium PH28_bin88]